jgi:hypothetical protein
MTISYSEKIQEFKENQTKKERFKENVKFCGKLHEFKNPDPISPKKYYHTVTFSGLAEAVSKRGGEDTFVSAIADAISTTQRSK